MDIKTLNARKEKLHKRVVADAAFICVSIIFVIFIVFIAGASGIFCRIVQPFGNIITCELLIIITILIILSWIFSLRRYLDVKEALKEFNSIESMKENIISNLRHELKTPLIPIKGYSELLYDEALGETNSKQKDALKKIITSSEKLERLIDSLIFISTAKEGDIEYTFTTLRIDDLITRATSELSEHIIQKKQILKVNIQPEMSFIEGDGKYLHEVLVQILDNAIKFSPPEEKIEIIAHEGYESLHIKIIDCGIGIPEEELENIFLRFYQIDSSKTRRYGGNGLGLHIAKTIIEAHKGNLWIESIPEKGTTVHIRLPSSKQGIKK